MLPRFDPVTFARVAAAPAPESAARRQRIRELQSEANRLRGQLTFASAMYLQSRSSADLLRQQQISMALERTLHQLRQLAGR